MKHFSLLLIVLTLIFGPALSPAYARDKAMIILDASGSMWGQINGKTKIQIARETLSSILGKAPKDLELGLIAYGHRRKGDCKDIETLVGPGKGRINSIIDQANKIKPKGKTPLSTAVKKAAESLRYQEDKATVILVTDGVETCNVDPCALAKELEEFGVDFTTHVVGFGLSKKQGQQVACLAKNTGGKYIQANNKQELTDALQVTVTKKPEPQKKPQTAAVPNPLFISLYSGNDKSYQHPIGDSGWAHADIALYNQANPKTQVAFETSHKLIPGSKDRSTFYGKFHAGNYFVRIKLPHYKADIPFKGEPGMANKLDLFTGAVYALPKFVYHRGGAKADPKVRFVPVEAGGALNEKKAITGTGAFLPPGKWSIQAKPYSDDQWRLLKIMNFKPGDSFKGEQSLDWAKVKVTVRDENGAPVKQPYYQFCRPEQPKQCDYYLREETATYLNVGKHLLKGGHYYSGAKWGEKIIEITDIHQPYEFSISHLEKVKTVAKPEKPQKQIVKQQIKTPSDNQPMKGLFLLKRADDGRPVAYVEVGKLHSGLPVAAIIMGTGFCSQNAPCQIAGQMKTPIKTATILKDSFDFKVNFNEAIKPFRVTLGQKNNKLQGIVFEGNVPGEGKLIRVVAERQNETAKGFGGALLKASRKRPISTAQNTNNEKKNQKAKTPEKKSDHKAPLKDKYTLSLAMKYAGYSLKDLQKFGLSPRWAVEVSIGPGRKKFTEVAHGVSAKTSLPPGLYGISMRIGPQYLRTHVDLKSDQKVTVELPKQTVPIKFRFLNLGPLQPKWRIDYQFKNLDRPQSGLGGTLSSKYKNALKTLDGLLKYQTAGHYEGVINVSQGGKKQIIKTSFTLRPGKLETIDIDFGRGKTIPPLKEQSFTSEPGKKCAPKRQSMYVTTTIWKVDDKGKKGKRVYKKEKRCREITKFYLYPGRYLVDYTYGVNGLASVPLTLNPDGTWKLDDYQLPAARIGLRFYESEIAKERDKPFRPVFWTVVIKDKDNKLVNKYSLKYGSLSLMPIKGAQYLIEARKEKNGPVVASTILKDIEDGHNSIVRLLGDSK